MRAGALLAALVMTAVSASAEPLPDSIIMNSGKMVAVDGTRRINLSCVGEGSPTVLFDAGWGDSTLSWALVQGEVAKLTRACAYDRAGIGFSDPRNSASDAKATVDDIHALLTAAKIREPILYVAHSMAGLFGVLLAASHPSDLAGMVLVDPSFANQWESMMAAGIASGATPATVDAFLTSFNAKVQRFRECAALPAPLPDDCAERDTRLPPPLANFKKMQMSRPSYLLTRASELENSVPTKDGKSVDQRQLEAVTANFGDKPLIVLTRGNPESNPGFTTEQSAMMYEAWKAGNEKLAALSTRGSHTVVAGSGHYIQYNKPQEVVDAVKRALTEIRGR